MERDTTFEENQRGNAGESTKFDLAKIVVRMSSDSLSSGSGFTVAVYVIRAKSTEVRGYRFGRPHR